MGTWSRRCVHWVLPVVLCLWAAPSHAGPVEKLFLTVLHPTDPDVITLGYENSGGGLRGVAGALQLGRSSGAPHLAQEAPPPRSHRSPSPPSARRAAGRRAILARPASAPRRTCGARPRSAAESRARSLRSRAPRALRRSPRGVPRARRARWRRTLHDAELRPAQGACPPSAANRSARASGSASAQPASTFTNAAQRPAGSSLQLSAARGPRVTRARTRRRGTRPSGWPWGPA